MPARKKLRVLALTSTLPAHAADPEPRFVLDLCKALADEVDFTILCPAHPSAPMTDALEGVRVIRHRYAPLRAWETLAYPGAIMPKLQSSPVKWLLVPLLIAGMYRRAARLMAAEEFDCVHCHWLIPQGIVGLLLKRRFGRPYVVTSHGGDIFSLKSTPVKRLMRLIMREAAQVTVVSEAIRRYAVSDMILGNAVRDPAVISMGVDTDRFHPRLRNDRWPERVGLSRPVIAFAGRLVAKKGVDILIAAMATNALSSTVASLAIIGEGPLRKSLEDQARSAGLHDRVRFLGALPHDDLAVALASADLFCAPSVIADGGDREGLPTVICEAAASGLAIVATRVSGIPEVVIDGVTGRLVPERQIQALADAISESLTNPEQRLAMGLAARQHIQAFSWCEVATRFAAVLAAASSSGLQSRKHAQA